MADLKISALTAASTPLAGTEVLPIVQSSTTKKVSVANLTAGRAVSMASAAIGSGATTLGLVEIQQSATNAALWVQTGGTTSSYTIADFKTGTNASALTLYGNSDAVFGGNLLVGTTSSIDGGNITTNYNGNNVKGLVLNDNTPANSHCYIAFDKTSGTQIGTITNNSNTGVLYNVTSDYRLKNVTGAVSGSGERIDALEPIEYEWKETGLHTRGFLAHKFQEVYANSVTGTKDAVDADGNPIYQAMQAGSAEVIADLVAEIKSLRQRLAAANL